MNSTGADLFTMPPDEISEALVRAFVTTAIGERLQAESLVLEFKREQTREVVHTVAAMSNTSGGLVLVGVDERAIDPLVGITSTEIDAIAQQLRVLAPGATPEFVSVALASTGNRAVLLLRVDPERTEQPVVVNGRVHVRIPGHNKGARRDEIVALVQAAANSWSPTSGAIPLDPGNFAGFGDEPRPGTLRIHAQWLLPRHASDRRYLGTASIEATIRSLVAGPVPNHICSDHIRTNEMNDVYWVKEDSAALRFTLRCEPNRRQVRGSWRFDAHAYVRLSGRLLDTLVETSPLAADSDLPMSTEALADQMLATSHAAVASGLAVAESIHASQPLGSPRLTGWLAGPIKPLLQLRTMWDAKDRDQPGFRLDQLFPGGTTTENLGVVVREWLTPFLLDLGATNFEDDVARFDWPRWVERLGLA